MSLVPSKCRMNGEQHAPLNLNRFFHVRLLDSYHHYEKRIQYKVSLQILKLKLVATREGVYETLVYFNVKSFMKAIADTHIALLSVG